MSRLIVKNLPKNISKSVFESTFAKHGALTDVQLVRTKSGAFRGFGFIGYKSENEAKLALKNLNDSLLMNQKISIEICNKLQVENKIVKKSKNNLKNIDENSTNDSDFLKMKTVSNLSDDDSDTEKDAGLTEIDLDRFSEFTCIMKGFPSKVKEKQIMEFFYPSKPIEVKVKRVKRRIKGGAIIKFANEKEYEKALKLNGECLSGREIKVESFQPEKVEQNLSKKLRKKKKFDDPKDSEIEELADSGRLFVRNLAYVCTESDLETLFKKQGPLVEVHMPIDNLTSKTIGIAFITYMMPEHAMKAYRELDGSVFMGRMIHILPAKSKPEHTHETNEQSDKVSSFKKDKLNQQKKSSQQTHNWNTLFMGTDAVTGAISEKYNVSKVDFLNSEDKSSSAVKLALGETQVVQETRQFLLNNGICLDAFSQPDAPRSKSIILIKNLAPGVKINEIKEKFEPFGELGRLVLAPAGVTAVIEFTQPVHAKLAFVKLAYRKFHNKPLYLEWAPVGTFNKSVEEVKAESVEKKAEQKMEDDGPENASDNDSDDEDKSPEEGTLLFVKNLNFDTLDSDMYSHFNCCGKLHSCTISKKVGSAQQSLSMGYGFVQYKLKKDATKALKELQKSMLDGHQLELKLSTRTSSQVVGQNKLRKKQKSKKQISSKILVRNVPFQANKKEIGDLFKTFGEIKSLRIPLKLTGSTERGKHRGFAFVDFISKQDAKKAFNALCHSTHLYGRRLVLEWADTEDDSVETLRRKTAENFHSSAKKSKTLKDFEDSVFMHSATGGKDDD